jgi:quercetin dioxygenase-like cupin family protein
MRRKRSTDIDDIMFNMTFTRVFCIVSAAIATAAPTITGAEQQQGWSLKSIPWQRSAANGTKFALLEGTRETRGGVFTYAFFIPAGVWDSPHLHSATARVFVAQGTFKIGFGDKLDKSKVQIYRTGDYLIVPGGMRHFDGADRNTIIIGVATGPWSTTYIDQSAPTSAGTPIIPKR